MDDMHTAITHCSSIMSIKYFQMVLNCSERAEAVQGMYQDENVKKYAVVAGGRAKFILGDFRITNTTEILDLDDPVEWKYGAELPFGMGYATLIQQGFIPDCCWIWLSV